MGKLQEGHADPELVEEISVFQNKMQTIYPTKVLEQVRNKVSILEQSNKTDSVRDTGADQATWNIGPGSATISSTIENTYDQKEYTKKLEESVNWLEEKLQKARKDFKAIKQENSNLKASNENHIFINEKLNKALKKSEQRIENLMKRVK
jgi:predicted RNase H-like nuclease (RuvC/YqgF family)